MLRIDGPRWPTRKQGGIAAALRCPELLGR
ncbi:hypothetical protein AZ54_19330 [Xanthomonas oryzae pv. oryzae PXO86]|nr:hypothetical protein AZ54_19330 [Xanthomonas oryzae pv. oryzae PXO86]